MAKESILAAWSNWTTVVRNLIELPFLVFAFKYIRHRLSERCELCDRIGVKYYPSMTLVKEIRCEANKVTQDSQDNLRTVNRLLCQFHLEIQRIPNNGSVEDIEIDEIRKVFSPRAAEIVSNIQNLIGKLDGMGKDIDWQAVCSSEVIKNADMIRNEWLKLLSIMAHKRFMTVSKLRREYCERAEGT